VCKTSARVKKEGVLKAAIPTCHLQVVVKGLDCSKFHRVAIDEDLVPVPREMYAGCGHVTWMKLDRQIDLESACDIHRQSSQYDTGVPNVVDGSKRTQERWMISTPSSLRIHS